MLITSDVEAWVKYIFIICFLHRSPVYFPSNTYKINM